MGVGTFYSKQHNMIIDYPDEYYEDEYYEDEMAIVFPKEKEGKYEILHKDFEEYESRIEQNLTVKKELRASSHLFAADIEVGVYADNYHSALMAVTDSELLNDYVWDTAGNMEEEDINELIFEIYPEVAEFLSEINDNKENISFAFNDEKDMENFIKNYEEMIEQIRNFIVNETAEYKNSEKTKEMIEFLSKYSSSIKQLKKEIEVTNLPDNELFENISKDKNFAFLFETSELYDRMYKLIKSDLDLLVENVDKEIIDYFNKLIVINDFGLFKIRTSSYTSETATYYNTEEDMKKVLSEIPEEDRRRFEKKLIAYKKQWEKISITPPKN